MTSIDRLQQMLTELRTGAARLAANKSGTSGAQGAGPAQQTGAPDISLQEQVSHRLRAIDPVAPEFSRQSRLAFFETVLAREFGVEVTLDPRFAVLVEGVAELIGADTEVCRHLDELLLKAVRPQNRI